VKQSHFLQTSFALVAISFLLAAFGFSFQPNVFTAGPQGVQAASGNDPDDLRLLGYVWSSTTGWISFCGGRGNKEECPGTVPYQVWVNNESGDLSGWGWSPNVGFISFDRSVTGAPPSGDDCGPGAIGCIDEELNGRGWGRFIAGCDYGGVRCTSSGAGVDSGGWDGWIRLGDLDLNDASFGVSVSKDSPDGSRLVGFAWGSEIVGYTSFDLASNLSIIKPEGSPDIQIIDFYPTPRGGGRVPLRVTLTAVVESTSDVEIHYRFDCGNAKIEDVYTTEKTATATCFYTIANDYNLEVTATQEGRVATASDRFPYPQPYRVFPPGIIEIPPEELPEDF